jgi:glyoxylase-like metal-dependent hydrolase (beta-lactamase superfamily II)
MYLLAVGSLCWAIDVGDANELLINVGPNRNLEGVFITHPHYDHIQGINDVARSFPNCCFYGSTKTLTGLKDSKLNLSFYHENPVVYTGDSCKIFPENGVQLGLSGPLIKGAPTPGHFEGSITYWCCSYVFTGDSFIPGIPVVTKLKNGNRQDSKSSLKLIRTILSKNTVVCPGHGPMKLSEELDDFDFPDLNESI